MKKSPEIALGMAVLTAITITAPCLGPGGIMVSLVTGTFLVGGIFYFLPMGNQVHRHYHSYEAQPVRQEPRGYTEGTERKALLPNGSQFQERIIRRYDQ